jgi:hypothetical protein
MSAWGFSYVENLSWVLLQPNHAILRLPYACLQRSHITLYIFRREGECSLAATASVSSDKAVAARKLWLVET